MEQNGTGDYDSEILRDIDDIINPVTQVKMSHEQLQSQLQQLQQQQQQPHIIHMTQSSSSPAFVNVPPIQQDSPISDTKTIQKPFIRIIEQPTSKAFRFRYLCEGRSAGSIPGANSTNEKKTYPTIEIVGWKGDVAVVVSCVTKDPPYRPHPHNLVGKEGCKHGVCTLILKGDPLRVVFSNLGIQCVRKKDIQASLDVRQTKKVDPFKTKFEHKNHPSSIDLNSVRLCFQAFLITDGGHQALEPAVSDPIFKKPTELVISRLCSCSAKVGGGDEIILLCEKVAKDDIKVKFYEIENEQVTWEAYAEFNQTDVHRQTAIAFRTPRYHSNTIKENAKIYIQLVRPSDGMTSEHKEFEYYPDPGMRTFSRLQRKIKRKDDLDIFQKILSLDSETTATKFACIPTEQDIEDDSNDTVSSDCSASNAQSSETINEHETPLVVKNFEYQETEEIKRETERKLNITEIELEVPQINYPVTDDSTQTSTPMEEILKQQQLVDYPLSMMSKVCEWMRSSEFERTDSLTVENGDNVSSNPQTESTNISSVSTQNQTTITNVLEEDKSFNELMAEIGKMSDGTHSRRDTLDNPILKELPLSRSSLGETEISREIHTIFESGASAQASVDLDETFDETATYNSLQIAFRNPIQMPSNAIGCNTDRTNTVFLNEQDGLVVLNNPPAPKIQVNAAQTPPSPPSPPLPIPPRTPSPIPDQKLPPLPPKPRNSQDLTSGEHSPGSSVELRTRNSSLSSSRPLSQIIIMHTPDQSPTKRQQNTPSPSPKKQKGFFSRLFSRRKSKNDLSPTENSIQKSLNTPNGSREPSIRNFLLSDSNRASLRSVKSLQPTLGNSLSAQSSVNGKRTGKPVGRSSSSVSGVRPDYLNADVIHIPLKGGSSSSLIHTADEAYSNASTLTYGHQLDRKTLSALQLADIPICDGNMELIAIADRQSIRNLCEGAYGVVLDPSVDLSGAEHFALYTSIPPDGSTSNVSNAGGDYATEFDDGSQLISADEIARRLAEANDELKRKRIRSPDANISILRKKLQNNGETQTTQFQNDFSNIFGSVFGFGDTTFNSEIKPEPVFLDADTQNSNSNGSSIKTFLDPMRRASSTSGGSMIPLASLQANAIELPQQSVMNMNGNLMQNQFSSHLPSMPNFIGSASYTPLGQQAIPVNDLNLTKTMMEDYQMSQQTQTTTQLQQQTITQEHTYMQWQNDNIIGHGQSQPPPQAQQQPQPEYTTLHNMSDVLADAPTLSGLLATIDFDDLPLSNLSIHERTQIKDIGNQDALRYSG